MPPIVVDGLHRVGKVNAAVLAGALVGCGRGGSLRSSFVHRAPSRQMHLRFAQMALQPLSIWSQRISSGRFTGSLAFPFLGSKVRSCGFTWFILVVVDP